MLANSGAVAKVLMPGLQVHFLQARQKNTRKKQVCRGQIVRFWIVLGCILECAGCRKTMPFGGAVGGRCIYILYSRPGSVVLKWHRCASSYLLRLLLALHTVVWPS